MTAKVSIIFGTRPEAIKMAPVVHAMQASAAIDAHVCVTGQHREMLDQVLEVFDITPHVDFELMRPNQTLGTLSASAIEAVDKYLTAERPDMVLVQGDTTTVFCASLAAFYHRIPVGHVEAGLRTGNLQHPWPEEANRVLTSRITSLHFAPTQRSRENLLAEGVADEDIVVTGNTVIDALFMTLEKVRANPPAIAGLDPALLAGDAPLVLITGHRRENFGEGFESICKAIATLARKFEDTQFVYPVHLNPNVREPVERLLGAGALAGAGAASGTGGRIGAGSGGGAAGSGGGPAANVHLIEPLPYLPFVALMDRATMILTDSGGVQEEAPSLGKPVLVMRDTTERPEAVDAGTVKLVGTDYDRIVSETETLLTDDAAYAAMSRAHNPYGDGLAARRIVDAVERRFAELGRAPASSR